MSGKATHSPARPAAKGWCPDAYRPMASGDGLIMRVRPRFGTLDTDQIAVLADLADRFSHGHIELTSRGSLQLRGLTADDIALVQGALLEAQLIDSLPDHETKRSAIFATHAFSPAADATVAAFYDRLDDLPEVPAKFCFGFDFTGTDQLGLDSCDILIRDTDADAIDRALDRVNWFVRTGGIAAKRMRHHITAAPAPFAPWPAQSHAAAPQTGAMTIAAVPFGSLSSDTLRALGAAVQIRFCYGRRIAIDGDIPAAADLITDPSDPLLRAHACVGQPNCAAATVATREIAAQLAPQTRGTLHVSGCAKGCAHPHTSDVTLVGRDGAFDLVRGGYPWDEPHKLGLSPDQILTRKDTI